MIIRNKHRQAWGRLLIRRIDRAVNRALIIMVCTRLITPTEIRLYDAEYKVGDHVCQQDLAQNLENTEE